MASNLISKIILQGVYPDLSGLAKKKVILTNKICLTLAVITLPYTVIFYSMGLKLLGILVGPIAISYFGFII
jgi:hypothetical protein